jgi:hypothetical protein
MENPIVAAKSSLSIGKIIGLAVGLVVVFALLDFTGLTDWILYPVTSAKAKFSSALPTTPK